MSKSGLILCCFSVRNNVLTLSESPYVRLSLMVGMVLAMSITLSTLRLIPPCRAMMRCSSL